MPGFMREMRVCGHAIDLDPEFLELRIVVGQITPFSRANESKVGRIEHYNRPFPSQVLFAHRHKLSAVIGRSFEWCDMRVSERHTFSLVQFCNDVCTAEAR